MYDSYNMQIHILRKMLNLEFYPTGDRLRQKMGQIIKIYINDD